MSGSPVAALHGRAKEVAQWIDVTCGYCSTGCVIEYGLDAQGIPITSRGKETAVVNRGKLCLKGIFSHEQLVVAGRGETPLRRDERGKWRPTGWDASLDTIAGKIKSIQKESGRDSFALLSTGQLFTEEFYTLGKLVRGLIGTNSYDGNTTLCMASAVSGYKRSFGSDGPPGCYDDFNETGLLFAVGSNLPECHPVLYWRLTEARKTRRYPVIVVDPRVTPFAQMADIHLPIRPGTDLLLLNAMAQVIVTEGLCDTDYVQRYTTGFADLEEALSDYTPEKVADRCSLKSSLIKTVARMYAEAASALSIWTMGINQSVHGSDGVVALNNLALLTGNVGKPGGSSFSVTGQCNAMGSREFSSCSGLPGYRALENEEERAFMAKAWNCDDSILPRKRGLYQTEIFEAIDAGKIRGLWIIATNPITSMPNGNAIRKALQKLDFLVVQDGYQDVETAAFADIYLPAALFAEKEGTFTNSERRVSLSRKIGNAPGNARSDLWIFNRMAERFDPNGNMSFPEEPADVFDELAAISQGQLCDYSGLNHHRLETEGGIQWPARADGGDGARLYGDGRFAYDGGKAKLLSLRYAPDHERPDDAYPLWLNSGRVVDQFHTRTRTGKIAQLNKYSPVPFVEINRSEAERLNVRSKDYVRIVSRRGETVALALPTERVAPDTIFMPMHFYESVNLLTEGKKDPFSRQPAFKQCAVRLEKIDQGEAAKIAGRQRSY